MKRTRSAILAALTCLALAGATSASADEADAMETYIGIIGELKSNVDPKDYEGIQEEIDATRDGSGAAGLCAGIRRGRLGLEAGWMLERSTRWKETTRTATGTETEHEAEVRNGGPYLAAVVDVLQIREASLYVKGGVARGNRWEAKKDGTKTGSGESGALLQT